MLINCGFGFRNVRCRGADAGRAMVLGFEVSNRHPTSCWGMLLHSYTTCGMYNHKYRHINMNIDKNIDNIDIGVGVDVDGDVGPCS